MVYRPLSLEEAATETRLPESVVRLYAECGLIVPLSGYNEEDIGELRRVRRLMEDLELNHEAIEVLLRMRHRIMTLEDELQRLRVSTRTTTHRCHIETWIEAEWQEFSW